MISFLVCAFNEEKNIKATIETIYNSVNKIKFINEFQIIVINDGSQDSTDKIIQEMIVKDKNITYLKNSNNLGIGKSIRKGLESVKYPKFMLIPGDNDMPVETITAALEHFNSADLVITFPINNEKRAKIRHVISKLFNLIYLIFFDSHVNYINAPAICPTEKVKQFKLRANRFGIVSEIAVQLLNSNITYCEIPCFYNFNKSPTKLTTWIKNLYDVLITFISLYLEIKIINRNKFLEKSKRKNVF
tara:strand:- start:45 stop:782 length:738 start_codon:yes stop_codon:yes gene_type:complete